MWAAFLTTLLFSISAVSGQRAAKMIGGLEANLWRLVCATLFLALVAHLVGGGLASAALPIFLLSGCVGFGIGDLALYQALPRIGSRLSVLLVLCLSSPLAATIEWLWLGTALSLAEMLAAALILLGAAFAVTPGQHLNTSSRQFTAGIVFGLVSSFCQGYGAVLSRKAFLIAARAGENIDGMTAAYQRILGGLAVAAIAVLVIKRQVLVRYFGAGDPEIPVPAMAISAERKERWRKVWPWVLLNGLSGSALGVSCYQWALKTTPTGIVLPIVATTPIVIIPFARYIEGERPTRRSLLGGFLAVCGAVALALLKNQK